MTVARFVSHAGASPMVAHYHDSVEAVGAERWAHLLPGKGEDWVYLAALERHPPPGFQLGAISVRHHGDIVAVAPVFRTSYRFDTSLQGRLRRTSERIHSVLPRLVSMDVLGLGSPLCDPSHIGFTPGMPAAVKRAVASEMLACLERRAREEGIPLIAAKGLDSSEAEDLCDVFTSAGYARVTSIPNVMLDLPFRTLDGYLASLPHGTGRYIQRKWRSTSKVRIDYRSDISDVKDAINDLYRSTIAQSRWNYGNFGPLHPDYFAAVIAAKPDSARLMLCWAGEELLSFQLFLTGEEAVLAKGIGMSYPKARDYNLYFVNWKEMIEHCMASRVPRISMAGTTYSTKLMLGGRIDRQWLFFRFSGKLLNKSLPWLAPLFDFESNDPELKTLNIGPDGRLLPVPVPAPEKPQRAA